MSGHSKWHNIQKTKGAQDAKKAKIFTKYAREMAIAIREGGADPASNSKLAAIIARAKSENVPNDNINRTLQKYQSGAAAENYEYINYEGYGPAGIAVIAECLTDNRNRTASDVRHYFDKYGGNMGAAGCVSWSFDKKGVIVIDNEDEDLDEEAVFESALEAGADVIMLDNMDCPTMAEAVKLVDGRALLEASGGITDETLRAVAETGVDIISIGALTHSVKAMDISMKIR